MKLVGQRSLAGSTLLRCTLAANDEVVSSYYQEYISTQECATLCSHLVSVADIEISHHVIFWTHCTGRTHRLIAC